MPSKINWSKISQLTAKIGAAVMMDDHVLEHSCFNELRRHCENNYFSRGERDWRLLETLGDFAPETDEALAYLHESLTLATHAGEQADSVRVSLAATYCYDLGDFAKTKNYVDAVETATLSTEDVMILADIRDRLRNADKRSRPKQ